VLSTGSFKARWSAGAANDAGLWGAPLGDNADLSRGVTEAMVVILETQDILS
jgi:hypothetical protein